MGCKEVKDRRMGEADYTQTHPFDLNQPSLISIRFHPAEALRYDLWRTTRSGRTVLLYKSVRVVGTVEHLRDVLGVVALWRRQKLGPIVGSEDLLEVGQRLVDLE